MKRNDLQPPKTALDAWMRAHDHLSDRILADKLGYHRSLVYRVRTGGRVPNLAFILSFQKVYGLAEVEAVFGPQTPQDAPCPAEALA